MSNTPVAETNSVETNATLGDMLSAALQQHEPVPSPKRVPMRKPTPRCSKRKTQETAAPDLQRTPQGLDYVNTMLAVPEPSHYVVFLHEIAINQRSIFRDIAKANGWLMDTKPEVTVTDAQILAVLAHPDNHAYRIPRTVKLRTSSSYDPDSDALLDAIKDRLTRHYGERVSRYTLSSVQDHGFNDAFDDYDRRVILCGYQIAVPAAAYASREMLTAFEESANLDIFSNHSTMNFVHGVVLDGVHYNIDPSQPVRKFVDVPFVSDVDDYVYNEKSSSRIFSEPTRVRHSDTSSVAWAENQTWPQVMPDGKPFRHGYLFIEDNVILTTFPNHAAFEAAIVARNTHPITYMDPEHEFMLKWGREISAELHKRVSVLDVDIEEARGNLRNLLAQRAKVSHILSLATDDAIAAIRASLESIKACGEVESVEVTSAHISVITKPMLGYNAKSQQERYCGQFEIQIHHKGMVRMRNVASPSEHYRNPHGECVGSFSTVFESAIDRRDYHSLVLTAMEYYRTFDVGHTSKWVYLPDSKEAPERVYVSEWQEILGTWEDAGQRSTGKKAKRVKRRKHSAEMDALVHQLRSGND